MCSYGSWGAYGQSKLANILHAKELAKRLKVDFFSSTIEFAVCFLLYWITNSFEKTVLSLPAFLLIVWFVIPFYLCHFRSDPVIFFLFWHWYYNQTITYIYMRLLLIFIIRLLLRPISLSFYEALPRFLPSLIFGEYLLYSHLVREKTASTKLFVIIEEGSILLALVVSYFPLMHEENTKLFLILFFCLSTMSPLSFQYCNAHC